jgi:hypothetical protein
MYYVTNISHTTIAMMLPDIIVIQCFDISLDALVTESTNSAGRWILKPYSLSSATIILVKMLTAERFLKHAFYVFCFSILDVTIGLRTCEAASLVLHSTEISNSILNVS